MTSITPLIDDFNGAAVYLEFYKRLTSSIGTYRAAVTQMIFVPESKPTAGSQGTPFCAYRRRITTEYPRRNWRMIASGTRSERLITENAGKPDLIPYVAGLMNQSMTGYIDQMAKADWELRAKPIVVEISVEDVNAVRMGKTPYKAIGKVLRVRKALGLPKDILGSATPV